MLSCGADGAVKLWNPSAHSSPLLKTFTGPSSDGDASGRSLIPTSVDWVYDDSTHLVAGYNSGACVIYDIETGKSVIKLDSEEAVREKSEGEGGERELLMLIVEAIFSSDRFRMRCR